MIGIKYFRLTLVKPRVAQPNHQAPMNRPAREFVAAVVAFIATLIVFRVALGVEQRLLFRVGLFSWTGDMAIATAGVLVTVFGLVYVLAKR